MIEYQRIWAQGNNIDLNTSNLLTSTLGCGLHPVRVYSFMLRLFQVPPLAVYAQTQRQAISRLIVPGIAALTMVQTRRVCQFLLRCALIDVKMSLVSWCNSDRILSLGRGLTSVTDSRDMSMPKRQELLDYSGGSLL